MNLEKISVRVPRWLAPLLITLLLTGCKSFSVSPYVSPRVTGCVVDAATERPIPGVKVSRLSSSDTRNSMDPPKGSQALVQAPFAHTDEEGNFVLESERSLIAFGKAGWYSVSLTFEHPRYTRISASYTARSATNTLNGVPVIHTGKILMTSR